MKRSRFTSEMTDKYYAFIKAVHVECIKKGYCDNITAFIKDYALSPNVTDALQDVGVLKNEPTKCSDESGSWFWIGDDPTEMMAGFIKAKCNAVTRPHQKNVQTRSLPSSEKLIIAVTKSKDHTEAFIERVEKVLEYLKKLYALQKRDGNIYNISGMTHKGFSVAPLINKIIKDFNLLTETGIKGYVEWIGGKPTEEISIKIVDESLVRNRNNFKKHKEKKRLVVLNSVDDQVRKQGYNPDRLKAIKDKPLGSDIRLPMVNSTTKIGCDISESQSGSSKYDISVFNGFLKVCSALEKDPLAMEDEERKSVFDLVSAIEANKESQTAPGISN